MVKRKIIISIIICLILIGALIALLILNKPKNNAVKCDYNSSVKTYLKEDPNCVINFLCVQGTTAFKDECGCGCEKADDTIIGGQRDQHGCLIPAGFSWNETEKECIKVWETGVIKYQVNTFVTCEAAGYPITGTNKETCTTPSGRIFSKV
jgi:hypothetical protein